MSVLRIIIGLAIPVVLSLNSPQLFYAKNWSFWIALSLFVIGVSTDFFDGWMARRHNLETPAGRILDPTADKIFILLALASFSALKLYSYWLLVPIFLREISVTFCRVVWMRQGTAIGAERAGKFKLGVQVASVLASFLYLARPSSATFYLNQFLIFFAVIMTFYSGYFFFANNRKLLRTADFARTVASLGVGYLRPFPGTYGTLLGLVLLPFISYDPFLHLAVFIFFLGLAYVVIPRMGLRGHEDPLEVVIDEVCGILLAFLTLPVTELSLPVGFFLFRFFDVSKTFPINRIERLKGTHGIILDDLGAGVYTWLILRFLFR